jgi:RND family efflux transporter MFP subunit
MSDCAPDLLRRPADREEHREPDPREKRPVKRRRPWGAWLFALTVLLALGGALYYGAERYNTQQKEVTETAQQQRDFVPTVRVGTVRASDPISLVSLPATTLAFATANINARASGYIEKRYVDIGDHVKTGQLLVQITGPELDHQISQAEGTLAQNEASVQQVQANLDLARITWGRDKPLVEKGWATQQQGSIDTQNIKALEANLAVAQKNVVAQRALVNVLHQQKDYQRVVAPFNGVITQRNVDVGTLVQADAGAVGGTFLFTLMQRTVIRIQVFVPQDQAFDLKPGVEAVVSVPEMPGRKFPGKVTRLADALQPGTRTLLTEIDVPNPDEALAVGIYCTVELHIPRKTPSLLVPSEALIFNSDGPQVAVVNDGVVHIRKVSVVRDLGTSLELNDGVKAGDKVVLNPSVNLTGGNRVRASG